MSFLLFPGRHHLLTNFQREYLQKVSTQECINLRDLNGQALSAGDRIDTIVWAVTSANHFNTRRNPLPAYRRVAAIEDLSSDLAAESLVYLIDDIGQTDRYAEYVLKKIDVESYGRCRLTPQNTLVGCSTPEVIELYEKLGFRILPSPNNVNRGTTWDSDSQRVRSQFFIEPRRLHEDPLTTNETSLRIKCLFLNIEWQPHAVSCR